MHSVHVENLKVISENDIRKFFENRREPILFKSADIGPCSSLWTSEYLQNKVGNYNVKVHVCESKRMDFVNKNFCYRTLPFCDLIKRASEIHHEEGNFFFKDTERYYLRSLGEDVRNDKADIRCQFPGLADDIHIPSWIPNDRFFSSVFRISSAGTTLWTHYDVMDNILIQVQGHKKAVLFPPDDVPYLYLKGDKSEVLDIDEPDLQRYPEFGKCTRYECIMDPGDILYIPALWFHNMTALEFGVAVNVFWKHLGDVYYDAKDPYGNKDYLPARQALMFADKAIKSLDQLPDKTEKRFYTKQVIAKLKTFLDSCTEPSE